MPRNGSGVYSLPPGSTFTPNTLAQSAVVNGINSDLATDLNTPRPVVAGGTGASTAAGASAAIFPGTVGILLPSINGAAIGGLRNIVYNGSFRVNQRVFGGGALGAGIYGYDRWKADAGGCTFTVAAGVATITAGTLMQIIPGNDVELTGTYTISWTGTATCTVNAVAATTASNVTLTAGANVTLKFTGGSVGSIQLEYGSVATLFEHRPFALELALAQQFFEKSYEMAVAPGSNQGTTVIGAFVGLAFNTASFYSYGVISFKVRKRADPTLNYWSMNGTQGVFFSVSAGLNQGNIGVSNISEVEFLISCANSTLTANQVSAAHWVADAEL